MALLQIDPAGDRDWSITAEIDLAASDEAGLVVVRITDVACVQVATR